MACVCAFIYFVEASSLDSILSFVVYIIWQTGIFFQVGFTLGNLDALALQPIRQIAGFASSITGGISTLTASILSSIVNRLFDDIPLPLMLSCFIMAYLAWILAHHLPVDIPALPLSQTVAPKQDSAPKN